MDYHKKEIILYQNIKILIVEHFLDRLDKINLQQIISQDQVNTDFHLILDIFIMKKTEIDFN